MSIVNATVKKIFDIKYSSKVATICHSERSVRIQNNLIKIHYDSIHLFLDPHGLKASG